jgi:hypothetical protein
MDPTRPNMKAATIKHCVRALLLWMFAGTCAAGDIYVIANGGVKLGMEEMRDVFLGEKQFVDSLKLLPVDNSAAQADFLAKVLKMEAGKYSTAWIKKAFRDGLSAPAVKSGDAEVVEFVKRTPGAVGYVSASPSGVNVIGKR